MKKYKVYRIEDPNSQDGMWYNSKGKPKKIIDKLCPNGKAKDLPMPYNELHKKDNKSWSSGGKSIEQMQHWFTNQDALQLVKNGYKLYEFIVPEIQELEFEVLFCKADVITKKEIELNKIWNL